jgi:hypothetical protein
LAAHFVHQICHRLFELCGGNSVCVFFVNEIKQFENFFES